MKYKLNRPEVVFWRDAFNPAESKWMGEKDLDDFIADVDFVVCNMGWIIHEDKNMVTIASMVSKQQAVAHIQRIPKGCIIKRTKIKNPF